MTVRNYWLLIYALFSGNASLLVMFFSWGLGSLNLLKHGLDAPVLVGVYETIPGVIFLETFLMGFGVVASIISISNITREMRKNEPLQ